MHHPPTHSGAYLLESAVADRVLTPEDVAPEHETIGRTVDEFWRREVEPELDALRRHEPGVGRRLLSRAAALGLTAMQIPERFGGLDLDLRSVMVAVEHLCDDASYSGWHLGHSGIGTLPIVYFGTEAQQARYLPRLATVDLLAAYALTEPQAGSDALNVRTRADLSADGRHYLLSGQKMWITNGGVADLFTVFAKVDGQHFTAFLVERGPGVSHGAQEHKMGIEGTSTTALYFDQAAVPVENVLGTVGRGHEIAFNVLNVGRLKIGPLAVRGARKILTTCVAYASTRQAFGRPIRDFGAIRHKLADIAVRLFATEAAMWRVVGLVEDTAAALREGGLPPARAELGAFEAWAAECSMIKVYASEMLDEAADHGVQIHGGYGYHRDYYVERAYRDARINRIFEGTNEINRLVIPTLVLKRAARHGTGLADGAAAAFDALLQDEARPADDLIARAKHISLALIGAAHRRFGDGWRDEQEVLMHLADALIVTFVLESASVRAARLAGTTRAGGAADAVAVLGHETLAHLDRAASEILARACDAPTCRRAQEALGRWTTAPPFDTIAARQRLATGIGLSGL